MLKPDWKEIAKRAWSMRLMALAVALTAAEVALPLFSEDLPRGLLAVLSGVVIVGAMVARVLVQRDVSHD